LKGTYNKNAGGQTPAAMAATALSGAAQKSNNIFDLLHLATAMAYEADHLFCISI
jgi:hypothetical protein